MGPLEPAEPQIKCPMEQVAAPDKKPMGPLHQAPIRLLWIQWAPGAVTRVTFFPLRHLPGLPQTSPIPTVTASLHRPPRGLSRSARRSGRHLPDLHSTPYQNNTRCSTPQKHWGRVFNISFSPTQQTRPWDTSKLLAAGSQYRRGTNHF